MITGYCEDLTYKSKCDGGLSSIGCSTGNFGFSHGDDMCIIGCCTTDACIAGLGFGSTTASVPQTTVPSSLYQRFKVNCTDALEDGVCDTLLSGHDICHAHPELCP